MHDVSPTLAANTNSPMLAGDKPGWVRGIAIAAITLGLVVLSGWAWNIDALQRVLPGLVSMKANTAAAFAISGICLSLHTLHQISPALLLARRIAATLILLLGLVTLAEYAFGWDAGIDQLLFSEPAGMLLTSHPGRMSIITAANFTLIGGALLLMEAQFWMVAQAIAFAVAASVLLPLGGYMFGNLSLTRIGSATAIAAHAAAGFLVLAVGILVATRSHGFTARLRKKSLAIGLSTSLVTLIFIFGAASYNFLQKDKASQWVEHTYEVILSMESFSVSLHDFLNHNRGFLITGDDRQLTERNKSRDAMLAELARVHQLTSGDPAQQERLAVLGKLVGQRLEWSDKVVRVRREKGTEEAATMVLSGRGDTMTDEIESKLSELENGERDLLKERQRVAEVISASSLFTLGVLLAASLLLLLWVFRTSQREITGHKQLEEKIRQLNSELEQRVTARTAELEAANKELEAFSYSVSHDLRTPLRAIDGFSLMLLEDYGSKLDSEGKRLLSVVRNNTSRMARLIDDILSFSRAGRTEMSFTEIDMEGMVREVIDELKPLVAGRTLQINLGGLPRARGDRAMMHQVFENLLTNAIKFTGKNEGARIGIGGRVEAGKAVYYVKDNGAGFDMQYAGKLFGVFQRLHGVDEFEGTGIGLAIVKRIIARHGGTVWAEGEAGKGAAFYFSIPVPEKNA